MDETYIGGRAKRRGGTQRNQKRVEDKFDMVVGICQRNGELRFARVKTVNKKTVSAVIEANIDPKVERVYTDAGVVYAFAMRGDLKAKHRPSTALSNGLCLGPTFTPIQSKAHSA